MKKFTFHVLGVPHTITNKDFLGCAFTQKVWKFCKMMGERGHNIYHYGHELSNPPYAENVSVVSSKIWNKVYGSHNYKHNTFSYDLIRPAVRVHLYYLFLFLLFFSAAWVSRLVHDFRDDAGTWLYPISLRLPRGFGRNFIRLAEEFKKFRLRRKICRLRRLDRLAEP